jgi:hypothetical protein
MCDECGWEEALELAEEMMADEKYEFAADTVVGIYEWIEDNHHVTERQQEALDNIYGSKQ